MPLLRPSGQTPGGQYRASAQRSAQGRLVHLRTTRVDPLNGSGRLYLKKMTAFLLLLLTLAPPLWRADGQGTGRGKTELPGRSSIYLGQQTGTWRPLVMTRADLTEVQSIKSTFKFRTFDPEGIVFYGDNKNGKEWFVLFIRDGVPEMQMKRDDIRVSVAGGPKLNDGKWHLIELSSQGSFVVLEVDGLKVLVVGLQSEETYAVITGHLRLALGGILIDRSRLIVQFQPEMDGCVRDGSWLNLTTPWETEVELRPCYRDIRPGSYFPGTGFAVFNASDFPMEAQENGLTIELWGDFGQMDGTILSIRAPGRALLLALAANNNTKEVVLTFGDNKITTPQSVGKIVLTFQKDFVQVLAGEEPSGPQRLPVGGEGQAGYLGTWREGRLAFGGLLGDGEDFVGTDHLTGCMEKIRVQERDLDLDLAAKHASVSSYSCPA